MNQRKNDTPAPAPPQLAFTGIATVHVNGIDGVTVDAYGRATLHTKNISVVLSRDVVDHLLKSIVTWTEERNAQ